MTFIIHGMTHGTTGLHGTGAGAGVGIGGVQAGGVLATTSTTTIMAIPVRHSTTGRPLGLQADVATSAITTTVRGQAMPDPDMHRVAIVPVQASAIKLEYTITQDTDAHRPSMAAMNADKPYPGTIPSGTTD